MIFPAMIRMTKKNRHCLVLLDYKNINRFYRKDNQSLHGIKEGNQRGSMKMKKDLLKRSLIGSAIAAIMLVTAACGKTAGKLPDQAASRSKDANSDVHYIDDNAIALAGAAASSDANKVAQDALNDVNAERTANGLTPLTWNTGLEQAAEVRAQECLTDFSHTRPDGSDWWTVNSDLMYGENLAYNYDDAKSLVDAWMASPDHRANILNGEYQTVGIAGHADSNGDYYWAQEFGY